MVNAIYIFRVVNSQVCACVNVMHGGWKKNRVSILENQLINYLLIVHAH